MNKVTLIILSAMKISYYEYSYTNYSISYENLLIMNLVTLIIQSAMKISYYEYSYTNYSISYENLLL